MNKTLRTHNPALFIFLAILFGVVRTLVSYSGFGYEDQVEQLPLIYRSFDSSYLQNDFFVNAALESAARTNYIRFIRLFTDSPENLPMLFFIFTLILNAAISLVTFLTGRTLFSSGLFSSGPNRSIPFRSNLAALTAAALVMLIPTFHLGASPHLFVTYFIPSSLAAPLMLLTVMLALQKRIAWAMLSGGAASLIHPLFGLETMALVLFAWLVSILLQKEQLQNRNLPTLSLHNLALKLIVPALLFTVFALLSILPQLNQPFQLDTKQFIHILGHFRHPHHYIPGSFPATHYLLFLAFLFAFSYAWYALKKNIENYHRHFILLLNLSILAACIAGYLFVEIVPLRLAAMAQTFRLLYLFKWTGMIFFAGFMVQYLTEKQARKGFNLAAGAMIVLFVAALFAKGLNTPESPKQFSGNRSEAFLKTLLSGEIISTPNEQAAEIAAFAQQYTPPDAVFLTPHNFGFFRLSAERAIVADFKSFPFTDQAMLEWYERINNCYGSPEPLNRSGFENEPLMTANYTAIDDAKLKELQLQYNFTHAVLFTKTATRYETLFSNEKYKIISFQ
ncbi:MAG: DUF6798 domain-containing protein [Bacteroidales bacterium]